MQDPFSHSSSTTTAPAFSQPGHESSSCRFLFVDVPTAVIHIPRSVIFGERQSMLVLFLGQQKV